MLRLMNWATAQIPRLLIQQPIKTAHVAILLNSFSLHHKVAIQESRRSGCSDSLVPPPAQRLLFTPVLPVSVHFATPLESRVLLFWSQNRTIATGEGCCPRSAKVRAVVSCGRAGGHLAVTCDFQGGYRSATATLQKHHAVSTAQ